MYSLVDSCMCPDQGLNLRPWCIGPMLQPNERSQAITNHFNDNGRTGDEFKLEVLEMRYWMKVVIICRIKEY